MGAFSSKVNMSSQLADFVREQIKKERVVIFSKTYCPYCVMAKKQFDLIHYPYHCIELDERNDGNEIQDILLELTGARTVPRVFIDGKCIGGGTDAKKMNDDGTLEKILKS